MDFIFQRLAFSSRSYNSSFIVRLIRNLKVVASTTWDYISSQPIPYWSFFSATTHFYPTCIRILVYGLLVQIFLSFMRVYIFIYYIFLIYLCRLFNRLYFMILFLFYHINYYFACINIFDIELLLVPFYFVYDITYWDLFIVSSTWISFSHV